jgi:hypothetical protein
MPHSEYSRASTSSEGSLPARAFDKEQARQVPAS